MRKRKVIVNDLMQQNYIYYLVELGLRQQEILESISL